MRKTFKVADGFSDAPAKPFFIRIYVNNDNSKKVPEETVLRAINLPSLQKEFEQALKKARRSTLLDGKWRWVEIEQCLQSVVVFAEGGPPHMSPACAKLMLAEINHEEKDGPKPSTLGSAIDSVRQGYNPNHQEFSAADMQGVLAELLALAEQFGGDTVLEHFVTEADRKKQ